MKQFLEGLQFNGEICMECILVSVFMGIMVYSISTIA